VAKTKEADNLNSIAQIIVNRIRSLKLPDDRPLLIAIDGGSGSGKSSIATILAETVSATLIATDDFFAAHIGDQGWLNRSRIERAADALDWQRLRSEVLEPLLRRTPAKWHSFDFAAGIMPDGSYATKADCITYTPRDIIVLEGAYSTRPELADLADLKILVAVPVEIRHRRLIQREERKFLAKWHATWDEAERFYFEHVRDASTFDMVVENS
jgi:uridine kinase